MTTARSGCLTVFPAGSGLAGLFLCVTVGVSAALLGACSVENRAVTEAARAASRAERALPVQGLRVVPRDLSRTLSLSAPVQPLRQVALAARTDGVLTEVLVEEGDAVSPGQVLARIDVREQAAELARAEALLAEQRSQLQRLERLRDSSYVDEASIESARATHAAAQAEAELWRTRVAFGTVTAPVAAVVIERTAEPGSATARLAALFTLADTSLQVIRLAVSELDVPHLSAGQSARVSIDALPGLALEGRVRRIFPAADPLSRLTTVEVALEGAERLGVRPGYLARVELTVELLADVLAVPLAAVAEAEGGESYVMVINEDNRLERRDVQTGAVRGLWQAIHAGLAQGEQVLASAPDELRPCSRVRVVTWLS